MEDRLSRWSRLKREAVEEAPEQAVPEAPPEAPPQTPPQTPPEVLEANRAAAEAVDPAAIDETTDMGLFEREGVPDWLKKRAFAALWRSNPVFANVDGLNDYDEDFADPSLVMTTFKSAWQAGRGYLEELVEGEEVAEREAAPAQEPVSLAGAEDASEAEPVAAIAPEEDRPGEGAEGEEVEGEGDGGVAAETEAPRVPLRARLAFD